LFAQAMPLGLVTRNGAAAPWVRSMHNPYRITGNRGAIRVIPAVGAAEGEQ